MKREDFLQEFHTLQPAFHRIQNTVDGLVRNALKEEGVDFVAIESRIKAAESAFRKILDKGYSDPFEECTDFVGLRVVVYLESDVDIVASVLGRMFDIDAENVTDKRKFEKPDSVGYRSLHLVGSLGDRRAALPEYAGISMNKFEIQIRTALQHTWAAIEHKRNYKGEYALPEDLQHRLMVVAGTLELIDREFSRISSEAEEYVAGVLRHDADRSGDTISFVVVKAMTAQEIERRGIAINLRDNSPEAIEKLIEELRHFGVTTVELFRSLISDAPIEDLTSMGSAEDETTYVGLIRHIMIARDPERYFTEAFKDHFTLFRASNVDAISRVLGDDRLANLMAEHGIQLYD